MSGGKLPQVVDSALLHERLRREERDWADKLAGLEGAIREFEDLERPAYDAWLRTEFGPLFSAIEEAYEELRRRRLFAARVNELVEKGVPPREALYLVNAALERHDEAGPEAEGGAGDPTRTSDWDEEEIEARRRAKREAKRSARKEKKAEKKAEAKAEAAERNRAESSAKSPTPAKPASFLSLYRSLARLLHPDAPAFVGLVERITLARAQSLWLEVQAGYEARDAETLWAISVWLEREGGADASGPIRTPAELRERIRALARAADRAEKKLVGLRSHPAWEFRATPKNLRKKLRQAAAPGVEARLDEARAGLEALEEWIESLGRPKAPRSRGR